MATVALAVMTVVTFELRATAVLLKITQRAVTDDHDVSAVTSVTAVGTALGHVCFAPEGNRPIATATGDHAKFHVVVEHGVMLRGAG
jgi:hypothetical protein